jgi:hypothetical protein
MRLVHTVNPSQTVRVCYRGRMNIYIDIDGPLIRNGQPTAHCFEFLRWAVEFHRPYWLTTRDAHGQHTGILRAFRHAVGSPELPAEIETLLRAVRPTEWFGSKITGVDLASDFVWIDDAPLRVEIETLRGLGLLNRLLVVDTDDGLLRAVDVIRAGLSAIEV